MQYPRYLKKNDKIGMTALSGGCKDCVDELTLSLNNLEKEFQVLVTPDVYGDEIVSASIMERSQEFNDLLDKDVKMIMIARGGDFLMETIPYLDYQKVTDKNIWIQGYSDVTSLLYVLTTKYDLATIYGLNGKSYDNLVLDDYQKNSLELLKGKHLIQTSFMDRFTKSLNGEFESSGLIIGGCLDVLRNLIGTKFDNTLNFLEKYKNQKIIWYFDIYAMNSVDVYLTLLQFKNAGWFQYSNTFLFGSVLLENVQCNLEYEEAIRKALDGDYHIVIDANIGHVKPVFTIINGSYVEVRYKDNKLSLEEVKFE